MKTKILAGTLFILAAFLLSASPQSAKVFADQIPEVVGGSPVFESNEEVKPDKKLKKEERKQKRIQKRLKRKLERLKKRIYKRLKRREKRDAVSARLEFKKPIALEDFLAQKGDSSFDRMILESSFSSGGEEIHDFYIMDGDDKGKDIRADYIKNRKAFLADLENEDGEDVTFRTSSVSEQEIEDISVRQVTVFGDESSINEIKNIPEAETSITNIIDTQVSSAASQVINQEEEQEAQLSDNGIIKAAAASSYLPMYKSVPKSGKSYIYPSQHGGRYTKQYMTWDSINFTPEQTYEHEVWLYNWDNKTYLDPTNYPVYPKCIPKTTYAATSWPTSAIPYLDSRLDFPRLDRCEKVELSYTIGVAKASELKANKRYYTYIRTANGNDSTDKIKVQAQVGHRTPSNCYTTFCSYGDTVYRLISFQQNAPVPGSKSWTFNGQAPAAPTDVYITTKTSSSLKVYFTDNTFDETKFIIERKKAGGNWSQYGYWNFMEGAKKWRWTNSSLSSNTTYCYRFKTTNAIGSSIYSNTACAKTL